MLGLVLVAGVAPGDDGGSVEDDEREEGVEEEEDVGTHGGGVEQHGLRRRVEGVGDEGGLDHDQAVAGGLATEHHAVLRVRNEGKKERSRTRRASS